MPRRRDNIRNISRPRFRRLRVGQSTSTDFHDVSCARCNKFISWHVFCPCESCFYCSSACRSEDRSTHLERCGKIRAITTDIRRKETVLTSDAYDMGRGIHAVLGPDWSLDPIYARRQEIQYKVNEYFDARFNLIKELIIEGCQQVPSDDSTNMNNMRNNTYALDIAITHCRDILYLRAVQKEDIILLLSNLYLMTGKLQEAYDLSCYFARKGLDRLDDHDLESLWHNTIKREPITKSYFKSGAKSASFFVNSKSCNWSSICYMYVVKFMLYTEMEKLHLINNNFLDNQDCIQLIGEYAGMKKEWIVTDRNHYRNQAMEIIRLLRTNYFYEYPTAMPWFFDEMKKFVTEHFPIELKQLIHSALEMGVKWIKVFATQQWIGHLTSSKQRWDEIIKSYEEDHVLLYTINIKPALPLAIRLVNAMSGSDVMGMNVDTPLGVTHFFTEATKMKGPLFFWKLFPLLDGYHCCSEDYHELELNDFESSHFKIKGRFSEAMMKCLLIEQKLAQCHFHRNKETDGASRILEQLPGGKESYQSIDHPKKDSQSPFYDWCDQTYQDIDEASYWLDDVTKVVDALFKADLASCNNLNVLFGSWQFVSYRVWELRRQQLEMKLPPISCYITRIRLWKEGCTDKDMKLGLKLKYLNKVDRRNQFGSLSRVISVGNLLCLLKPSLQQFATKFGPENLGFSDDALSSFVASDILLPWFNCSATKRPRCELDGFLTLEEACRHYFDCRTLEEAIWDLVGIPRIIVLDHCLPWYNWRGREKDTLEKKLEKAGWKSCGQKANLGDLSVQLGRRVAHVINSPLSCSVWEEQGLYRRDSSPDTDMDSD